MGVTVATTRVAASIDTAPYTQDIITADLGGLTPKAALFIVSYGVTDATAADHHNFSYGAATGASNEWSVCNSDKHGQAESDVSGYVDSDRVIKFTLPGASSIVAEAEFSSFIANGVRINWINAPESAFLITVVLFAGTDLSAHAGYKDLADTENLAVDVTDPGFEPDVVLTAWRRYASVDGGGGTGLIGFGAVHNGVAVSQRSMGTWQSNNAATSACILRYSGSYGAVVAPSDWGAEFGDFDANGFTATIRDGGAEGADLLYLALNFNGAVDAWVGTHITPTSTGNDSETGPSFKPQFVLLGQSLAEAVDTDYIDNRAGSFGLSAFDADDEYTTIVSSEDEVGTTNTQSLADDRAIVVPNDDGVLDIEASFVSFDANGWTVNYTNAPATAKLFWALAIEEETGAISLTVQDGAHTHSGDSPHLSQDQFLVVADGSHTQTADSPHLSQDQFLVIQDGSHTHTADNVILIGGVAYNLVIQDGSHTHNADSPHLSQDQFIVVQDGEHQHISDGIIVTEGDVLLVRPRANWPFWS